MKIEEFVGFKARKWQKVVACYLHVSKKLILFLLKCHESVAEFGVTRHPCWAGGFSMDEGVCSQPCSVCDPLNSEEGWANKLRRVKA